jgi:hypothetical protein
MRGVTVVFAVLAMAVPAFAITADEIKVEGGGAAGFDRHKVTVGVGGGYGKVSVDEDGVFSETSSTPDDFSIGLAMAFEYAYRLNPQLSIGAYLSGWMGALDGELGNEDWIVTSFGGAFQYRPTGDGFYLKGGFGACGVTASIDDPESEDPLEDYSDYGFGVVGAIGYDIYITPNYAAGPRLEVQAVDVGGGVTAISSSLLFTFTF